MFEPDTQEFYERLEKLIIPRLTAKEALSEFKSSLHMLKRFL